MTDKTCEEAERSAMDRLTRLGLMTEASRQLVTAMVESRDEEMDQLRAERDALKAAIADVRRLQELTIAASCRVQAIDQATDTLAVLDRALAVPESTEGGEDAQWRQDEREVDGSFTGCEYPRLWPPRTTPETTPDAPKGGED